MSPSNGLGPETRSALNHGYGVGSSILTKSESNQEHRQKKENNNKTATPREASDPTSRSLSATETVAREEGEGSASRLPLQDVTPAAVEGQLRGHAQLTALMLETSCKRERKGPSAAPALARAQGSTRCQLEQEQDRGAHSGASTQPLCDEPGTRQHLPAPSRPAALPFCGAGNANPAAMPLHAAQRNHEQFNPLSLCPG